MTSCFNPEPVVIQAELPETFLETADRTPGKKVIVCDYLVRALEEDRDTFQAGNTTIYLQDRYEPLTSPQILTLRGKAANMNPWQGQFVDKWELSQEGNLLVGFYTKDFDAVRILPCRIVIEPIEEDEPIKEPKK
jgi:hypothetical protein